MIRKILIGIGGFLAVLGFTMLGRDARRAKKEQRRADNLQAGGIQKDLDKARKHQARAETAKNQAKETAEIVKVRLDQIGKSDETMADSLSAWDAARLRRKPN